MTRPTKVCRTAGMLESEWLELRRKGIGGSDAAAVCGMSPWNTPLGVYLDKTGISTSVASRDKCEERMHFGHVMEDVVASEFALRNPKLRVCRSGFMYSDAEYPWMLANVDRVVRGESAGLECKNVSEYGAEGWEHDGVPDHYRIQCLHYMRVMGWRKMYIAAIIGGNRYVQRAIHRDSDGESLIEAIISAERVFWKDHVEQGVPPAVSSPDDVKELFPRALDVMREPEQEDIADARELARVQAEIKALKLKEDELKVRLQYAVGTAEGLRGLCTFKNRAGAVSYQRMAEAELGAERVETLKDKYRGDGGRVFRLSLSKEYAV
ncbi:MAG: YqaJ viral recombinase family protein [Pyramidobacter sp.]|nr:YqaJ viral recombinase family protein [Pyramidobacter sp.]